MKHFLLFFLALTSTPMAVVLASAAGENTTVAELKVLDESALNGFTEKQKASEADLKKQDAVYGTLRKAVEASMKDPKNDELKSEIFRVTGLLLKKDSTQYAGEVLLPLYKQNKKSFLSSLKKLSKDHAKEIETAVKDAEKEEKSGNG